MKSFLSSFLFLIDVCEATSFSICLVGDTCHVNAYQVESIAMIRRRREIARAATDPNSSLSDALVLPDALYRFAICSGGIARTG